MTTAAFLEDIMRLFFCTVSTLTLIISSAPALAAEVRVLSIGSTQIAAKAVATEFERETRHKVTFTIRPPFDIDKELSEKTFDAVILSVPAMDNHDEAGDLVPMSRVALARVGVGVVVKEGGPVPDGSTPEKLKAAVLAARSLTYTEPATPNTSGAIAAPRLPSSEYSMRSKARRGTPRWQSPANWSLRVRSSWASSTSRKSRRASPWLARCPARCRAIRSMRRRCCRRAARTKPPRHS
jgi:hypothetical protein